MEQLCLFEFRPISKFKKRNHFKNDKKIYKNFEHFLNEATFCKRNFERFRAFAYFVSVLDMTYPVDISIRESSRMMGGSREKIKPLLNFWVEIGGITKNENNKYCIGV